jgi:hypothetical protein
MDAAPVDQSDDLKSTAQTLQLVYAAQLMGVAIFWLIVVYLAFRAGVGTPSPEDLHFAKQLSGVHGSLAPLLWLAALRADLFYRGELKSLLIVKAALVEGAAMLGGLAGFISANSHVLSAHPEYWLNALSLLWMGGFFAMNWPSAERLRALSQPH